MKVDILCIEKNIVSFHFRATNLKKLWISIQYFLQDLSVEGSTESLGGVRFQDKLLLPGKALEFGIIFQNMNQNYYKYEILMRKFEKMHLQRKLI